MKRTHPASRVKLNPYRGILYARLNRQPHHEAHSQVARPPPLAASPTCPECENSASADVVDS